MNGSLCMGRPAGRLHRGPASCTLGGPAGIHPEPVRRPWLLSHRLAQSVTGGPPSHGRPATDKPEHDEHHDAEEESRARQVRPETDQMPIRVLGEKPGDHQEEASHQQHGAKHRAGNDYPHPSGSGLLRAHCSTIASRYVPRKLYEQERW